MSSPQRTDVPCEMGDEAISAANQERAETLGLGGWIVAGFKLSCITFILLYKAFGSAIASAGNRNGLSRHRYVLYEGMRLVQRGLNSIEIQNFSRSTAQNTARYAKHHDLQHEEITLRDGTKTTRTGPRRGRKAIILMHGGGYAAPAQPGHIALAHGFAEQPAKDVTVFVLHYALASEHSNHYPRQLQQAASLLDHVLHSEGFSPSDILLIGDSAGAHLVLSLLVHVCQANPQVTPISMNDKISGAALISPWMVDIGSCTQSVIANRAKDILDADALTYWAHNFLGSAKADIWNVPLKTPVELWRQLPVSAMLLTYGENELLRDDIVKFGEIIGNALPDVTIRGFPQEAHEQMVTNMTLSINECCESKKVFVDWFKSRIQANAIVVT